MAIEFGMLQAIKAKSMSAQGPQAAQQRAKANEAQSIYDEYNQYKEQLAQAEQNGGETGSSSNVAFGSTSMSVDELQLKIEDCENEFKQYYAMMNETPEAKPQQGGENEEEKNKVKPKEFGSLMA